MRETLAEMGWTGWPKTSGNRGIHVACRIEPNWDFPVVRRCALAFAREVERRLPKKVTTAWWKEERGKRVFIDYNQNARDRTIASAYSVRGRPDATVSAPVTWDELPDVETEDFTLASMPERFAKLGDVQARSTTRSAICNVLLEWVEREEAAGEGEAPYPPQVPEDARRAEARPALAGQEGRGLNGQLVSETTLARARDESDTGSQIRRRSAAQRVSSWRFESCSLRSTAETCVSTVLTERCSRAAISL